MKKNFAICLFALFFLVVNSQNAFATPILVNLDAPQQVDDGTSFSVDVNVTGLKSNGYLLSAYSFDLFYQPDDVIEYSSGGSSFGGELGGLGESFHFIDPFVGPDPSKGISAGITKLEVFGVSFLFDAALELLQTDDVITLVSIAFEVPIITDSPFNRLVGMGVTNFILSDPNGDQIPVTNSGSGKFILVPEPTSLSLTVVGLLCLFGSAIRNKRIAS